MSVLYDAMERLYTFRKHEGAVFDHCDGIAPQATHRYLIFYAVRQFMEDFESLVLKAIQDDPSMSFEKLVDVVYAQFIQRMPEELYDAVAQAVSQQEFIKLVEQVIHWNPPPHKASRTFDECVMALCPGTIRHIVQQSSVTKDVKKSTSTKKRTTQKVTK